MKKVLAIILTIVMVLSSTTVVALAAQQEYNFEDNRISLSLRHSDYVVSLENFSKYGVIEIEETSKYWYVLTLDKHDHQNVLDVISQLEHAEDAYKYSVHVIYIPVEDPFKDSEIKAKFVEEYEEPQFYDEIYYHYFDEEKTMLDWVLINAVVDIAVNPIENPTPRRFIVGDIVYSTVYYYGPFIVPYCVYDAEKDEFIGISQVNFDEYEGLREVFCTSTYGKVIGDVDSDGQLSVMDATEIQRIVANLLDFSDTLVADFTRDKVIDVMDATAIQRKLAGLDKVPVYNEEMVFYATDYYDGVWNLEAMPQEASQISFEMQYDKQQFSDSDTIYNYKISGDCYTLAIIKSNEQYRSFCNEKAPVIDDEFFDNNWLVVALTRCHCHEAVAPITDIAKLKDTLYVRANVYVPEGPVSPTEPMWLSMVSVDKDDIANVTNIVKVK